MKFYVFSDFSLEILAIKPLNGIALLAGSSLPPALAGGIGRIGLSVKRA
jgi:hypothetical protein